jgi:hypothetical protein
MQTKRRRKKSLPSNNLYPAGSLSADRADTRGSERGTDPACQSTRVSNNGKGWLWKKVNAMQIIYK